MTHISHFKEDLNRIKNIMLFTILVLGNVCVNEKIVGELIQRNLITVVIYDLWRLLEPDYYEDVSFLIANMLFHYPFNHLFILENESDDKLSDGAK